MIVEPATPPWYRQFWPWFLIALPASVVVASFNFMYIAFHHADDLVVDDYYKEGLAINRQLAGKQYAEALSLHASLSLGERQVTVHLPGEELGDSLQLLLSHPLEADRDLHLVVQQVAPGVYLAPLPHPVQPRWHWRLSGELEGQLWRLDGTIGAEDIVSVGQSG